MSMQHVGRILVAVAVGLCAACADASPPGDGGLSVSVHHLETSACHPTPDNGQALTDIEQATNLEHAIQKNLD